MTLSKLSAIQPPSWWPTLEEQLDTACRLWPDVNLPEPPAEFVPQTETEVLLLHVPRPFDELWHAVQAPSGYTKVLSGVTEENRPALRLAPNVPHRTTPVWLGFDPEHGRGKRPDSFWGQPNLAASEVLSALIQFPDWPLAWRKDGVSVPNLTGYQLAWSYVLCFDLWDKRCQLRLDSYWASLAGDLWSSPVVREC